jgi:hypothetical protein
MSRARLSPVSRAQFLEPRRVTGIACRSVSSNLGARAPRNFLMEIHGAIKTRASLSRNVHLKMDYFLSDPWVL